MVEAGLGANGPNAAMLRDWRVWLAPRRAVLAHDLVVRYSEAVEPAPETAASSATWRIRADLRLAAWLRWMIPRAAALSNRLTASRKSSAAPSWPALAAKTADLIRVLTSDFAALLRRRRFSLVPIRLIWLFIFATGSNTLPARQPKASAARWPGPWSRPV